jgi:5-methylcytosine-specific restriction protein A
MDFEKNAYYTRESVWKIYHPNEGEMPDGGNWKTGYTREGSDLLAFMNIGTPGRTGHDFANSFDEANGEIVWFGKNFTHSKQPTFIKLLNGSLTLHFFARWDSENVNFLYLGVGVITSYEDDHPVKEGKTAIKVNARLQKELLSIGAEGVVHENDSSMPIYGKRVSVVVNKYERDPDKRKECINHFGHKCQICDFSFDSRYGELGQDYCHVHHIEPLSEVGGEHDIDPTQDMIPVCANCHAMLHRKRPALKPDELRRLLKK